VIFALISAVYLYATHLGKPGVEKSVYFAAAFLLTIAAWQISNIFVSLKLRRKIKSRRISGQTANDEANELNFAVPNNALPEAETSRLVRPATSVTENTTNLLEHIPQQRKNS
jgi:hypothetical protein